MPTFLVRRDVEYSNVYIALFFHEKNTIDMKLAISPAITPTAVFVSRFSQAWEGYSNETQL